MKETPIVTAILDWSYYQKDLHLDRVQSGRLSKKYTSKRTGQTRNYNIRLARAGSADIWGVIRDINGVGRAVFIEAKIPGQEIAPESDQAKFKQKVDILGAIHIVAHSLDEVIEGLKPYRRAIQ